jgi:hypothetical protein
MSTKSREKRERASSEKEWKNDNEWRKKKGWAALKSEA